MVLDAGLQSASRAMHVGHCQKLLMCLRQQLLSVGDGFFEQVGCFARSSLAGDVNG
jgi:hypothetical protein